MKINKVHYELSKRPIELRSTKSLDECYKNCSHKKYGIYARWENIAAKLHAKNFGVSSYNSMIFTLQFDFNHKGKKYRAWITPTHNYLSELC